MTENSHANIRPIIGDRETTHFSLAKKLNTAGGVGIIAEVDYSRIETRHSQGWVSLITESAEEAFRLAADYMKRKETISIAYHGNIVDLLQYAVDHEIKIELLSDQTS